VRCLLVVGVLVTGGCDRVFGLDEREAPVPDARTTFGSLEPVTLQCPAGQTASDPTIADEASLFAYSCSASSGGTNLHEAERLSPVLGGSHRLILGEMRTEGSPEFSPDGRSLYFLTFTAADIGNIELIERTSPIETWGAIQVPPDLNTLGDDRPGSPDRSGNHIVISRGGVLLEFVRTPQGAFTPLQTTDTLGAGPMAVNPHLSNDGLTLVFAAPDRTADLYIAYRQSVDEAWGAALPITELNTTQNEADPWISPDGNGIYFARQGVLFHARK
jgi:hypothetical protein